MNLIQNFCQHISYAETFNFNNFINILEFIPKINNKIKYQIIDINIDLIKTIDSFCKDKNNKKIIISLSGGVDSMVLITILHYLNYDIIAAHINYNNRKESIDEQNFLENWCLFNNIKLHVKYIDHIKRDNTKRSDYELITKNIRHEFYKQIIEKENAQYVLLGHHKDDIIENIFANVCRGRNILDLAVIKNEALINQINIGRPMLDYYKTVIYDFANLFQVPYFKDTTPEWSVRGKYRNLIQPTLHDTFTNGFKNNLIVLSNQSDDWNKLIYKQIIDPFMNSVVHNINNDIIEKNVDFDIKFNIEKYIDYPVSFWNIVFMKIFNSYGYSSPSRRGVETFINTIKQRSITNNNARYNVTLCNKSICIIKKYNVFIKFKK
tara:strand:+ start:1201 stop:2337 length:1137 start_codon:yes stop_codon:yes gene_type:complete